MSGFDRAIRDELSNKEFRESYVAENVRRGLAYQIRALREAQGWSPAEFARQAGLPHSNISRWENPAYGKFSLSTLIEIASVFDVALSVRFVGFEELLISLSDLRPQTLAVPSYEEEQKEREDGRAAGGGERARAEETVEGIGKEAWRSLLAPRPSVPGKNVDEKPPVMAKLEDIAAEPISRRPDTERVDLYDFLGLNPSRLTGPLPRKERPRPKQLGDEAERVAWMS